MLKRHKIGQLKKNSFLKIFNNNNNNGETEQKKKRSCAAWAVGIVGPL